ncbi:MAG: hypothetical protein EZS28_037263 [Streblomastix strix]|uniref:Transmembrane protein n=1 Tax=Streblomastix strix TaxID=222440 RepID=A0A5J4U9Z0_9EUKA|nr:MAG: hypothetical protein EZS28_037263 [Streblomastix strix]
MELPCMCSDCSGTQMLGMVVIQFGLLRGEMRKRDPVKCLNLQVQFTLFRFLSIFIIMNVGLCLLICSPLIVHYLQLSLMLVKNLVIFPREGRDLENREINNDNGEVLDRNRMTNSATFGILWNNQHE